MADKTITITLRKSLIGEKPKTRATVRGLGLRKINQTVTHRDDDTIRGMVHRVRHLVTVEEE
ncbi:MAG: 50S ribosomal protein L30 [Acidimicrobiia bacterium]